MSAPKDPRAEALPHGPSGRLTRRAALAACIVAGAELAVGCAPTAAHSPQARAAGLDRGWGWGRTPTTARVGDLSDSLAASPDGRTLYVALMNDNAVLALDLPTKAVRQKIQVGGASGVLSAIAITPDGRTLYTANWSDNTVTPIDTATMKLGALIRVGTAPANVAASQDALYVSYWRTGKVTKVNLRTGKSGTPVYVDSYVLGMAVTPDDRTLYVANGGSKEVTAVDLATGKRGRRIYGGSKPYALTITPDARRLYVATGTRNDLVDLIMPVGLPRGIRGIPIEIGRHLLQTLAVAPDGRTLFVANADSPTVSIIPI